MDMPCRTFDIRYKGLDYEQQFHLHHVLYKLQLDMPFYRLAHHNGYTQWIQRHGREYPLDPPAAPEPFSVSYSVQADKSFYKKFHTHDIQYNVQYLLEILVFLPLFLPPPYAFSILTKL